jgi:hypothetical protein
MYQIFQISKSYYQLPLRYEAMDWTVRDSNSGDKKKFCPTRKCSNRLWGPTSLLFRGYGWSLPEVKRPSCECYHLPPSSAEVKNEWSYTSSPSICFHNLDRYIITFLLLSRLYDCWWNILTRH